MRIRDLRARLPARPSRIGRRLLAFNLLVVFLPVAGVLYLDVYEQQLLAAQERGMIQQARLVAASFAGNSSLADEASDLFRRYDRRGDTRVRVYSTDGRLLADTARVPEEAKGIDEPYRSPDQSTRTRWLYRVGVAFVRVRTAVGRSLGSLVRPARHPYPADEGGGGPGAEVFAALKGSYGAATRPTPGQRSLTLFSAVPIRSGHEISGAVLVSQSTFRILQALYSVRLRIFEIVVASLLAAALLSAVSSTRIVRPLVRLRRATAVLADRPTQSPVSFPGTDLQDEIGDLSRALEELTRRLDAHVRLLESFAADVSHEFKNPLASIRTAAEMLMEAPDESERHRFMTMLTRDVDRLERLVSGVRELARIDARLAYEDVVPVDLAALLSEVIDGIRLSAACALELQCAADCRAPVVRASPERLGQVFENILVNACSFTLPGSCVSIVLDEVEGFHRVTVADHGPGIPPEHLDRIFDRFFTYRPHEPGRRDHAGLGLAISRAIVEGYGGSIAAANDTGGGARFTVRLPAYFLSSSL